jgi:hypothetical protein
MSYNFDVENSPNPAKLIDSLRYLGYSNQSAVADIVDNCWDAQASKVLIDIGGEKRDIVITIADNGVGMDDRELDQALRLGSLIDKNVDSDLGKFGMGLVTASLSLGRRTEVITKDKNGKLLHSIVDVDEIKKADAFCKFIGPADASAAQLFEKYLPGSESGTVVRVSKCDQIQQAKADTFAKHATGHLGRIYRVFLDSGKSLLVNNISISATDPLMMNEGAEIESDEKYEIKLEDADGILRTEDIRVRLVLLPSYGQDGNKDRGINPQNQGLYVLRNHREIASAVWLGITNRHSTKNRIRGEIFFPASLDEHMGVNFTKHELHPKQAVWDKLNQIIAPQVRTLTNKALRDQKGREDQQVSHDEASRLIGQKANLLAKPKLEIERRSQKSGDSQKQPESEREPKKRENLTRTQLKEISLPCRFETKEMGLAGAIYDSYVQGKTLVIQWNTDHPFYQRFILDNRDNPSMVTAADFLVYSLAAAEEIYAPEDERNLLQSLRSIFSSNMRTLLT